MGDRTAKDNGRAWDVVVVGGANADVVARGPRLPLPGESVQGDAFLEAPGGKGANQAVGASRLGARTALIGCVGDDERGRWIRDRLIAEGVDTRHLLNDADAPTGVAVIQVAESGEKQILTSLGVSCRLAVDDVRGAAAAIRAARVLLVQLEAPLECVLEAARIAREAGAPIVLDPAPAIPLPDELLRLVSVVRPNAREAGVLTGVEVRDVATAREAAWSLLARGVGAIVVQAGEEGNLLVDREGELFLPELAVHTVDSTGAGDALAAALATLIAEGRPLSVAARFANAAAAHATTVLGAQAGLPRRSDVEALLARAPAP